MEHLILLCACFLLGIVLGRGGRMPASAPSVLNGFIINVSLPALALLYIHELRIDASLLVVVAVPWALFLLGSLFFIGVGRRMGLSRGTIGCLILTGALGNTSFVGLPMIEAFFGHDALGIGIIADQPGTFLILSTFGLMVAARASSGAPGGGQLLRRVFRFPPFIAMLAALLLLPVGYPPVARFVLGRLGDTLTPLALVSVGMQLRLSDLGGNWRKLGVGLLYKLLLGPAVLLVPLLFIPALHGRTMQVAIFEAAMPPMITGGIVAIEHDLDPPLATLLLGIGIPLSFLTLPAWWWVLRWLL